jgi:hypothetical protein
MIDLLRRKKGHLPVHLLENIILGYKPTYMTLLLIKKGEIGNKRRSGLLRRAGPLHVLLRNNINLDERDIEQK